jgi:two-component system NarL family response regulator
MRKILVVEDDPRIRTSICDRIARKGDMIYECYNGDIAVSCYERIRPDLVLMDIEIEGLNGLEATRKIRMMDPEARIVIVSQYSSPAFRKAAQDIGAADYVVKDNLEPLPDIIQTLFK